jgi:hypothetical protein
VAVLKFCRADFIISPLHGQVYHKSTGSVPRVNFSATQRDRGHRHRERALDRSSAAVKRKFANDCVMLKQFTLELPAACKNADRSRQNRTSRRF